MFIPLTSWSNDDCTDTLEALTTSVALEHHIRDFDEFLTPLENTEDIRNQIPAALSSLDDLQQIIRGVAPCNLVKYKFRKFRANYLLLYKAVHDATYLHDNPQFQFIWNATHHAFETLTVRIGSLE